MNKSINNQTVRTIPIFKGGVGDDDGYKRGQVQNGGGGERRVDRGCCKLKKTYKNSVDIHIPKTCRCAVMLQV